MPKISVFMPTYNCSSYLKESIDSILNQTYENFELVIINDGSTDNTKDILNNYSKIDNRIKIYSNDKNEGIYFTRNRGLDLCNSEYTALMDADDIATIDRLEHSVKYMDSNKDIILYSGGSRSFDEKWEDKYLLEEAHLDEQIKDTLFLKAKCLSGSPFVNSTIFYRTQFVKTKGIRYREYKCCQDYAFFQDMLMLGANARQTNKVLCYYRNNPSGITSTLKNNKEYRFDIYDSIHKIFLQYLNVELSAEETQAFLEMQRETSGGTFGRISSKKKSDYLNRACDKVKEQCKNLDCYKQISERIDVMYKNTKYQSALRKMIGKIYHYMRNV